MVLALHIQLVHSFVEQMTSNTPFSLIPFVNGINLKFKNTLLKLGRLTTDLIYGIHYPF